MANTRPKLYVPPAPSAPFVPGAPAAAPSTPFIPGAPATSSAPFIPGAPATSSAPFIPGAPATSSAPFIPGAPATSSAPFIPGAQEPAPKQSEMHSAGVVSSTPFVSEAHTPAPKQEKIGDDKKILDLNQDLLNCIASGDFDAYKEMCSVDITCFEPETTGHMVQGLPFHKFYFDLPSDSNDGLRVTTNVVMSNPHVRWLGANAAAISYVRLNQTFSSGKPIVSKACETRIWQKDASGRWTCVHVHRS